MSQAQPHDLIQSLQAVRVARSDVCIARTRQASRLQAMEQQQELLCALQDCAASLARHGHPVPYRMRSDIAMYRTLLTSGRHGLH